MTYNSATLFIVAISIKFSYIVNSTTAMYQTEDSLTDEVITVANISHLFDKWLPSLQRDVILKDMDPLELPHMSNENLPISSHLTASINLSDGWLRNLSTIRRSGDILIKYSDEQLTFDINLGWDSLDFRYKYLLGFLILQRQGIVYGYVEEPDINILLTFHLYECEFRMKSLKFRNVGKYSVRLYGSNGDTLINALTNFLSSFVKKRIFSLLEAQLTKAIQGNLDELNANIKPTKKALSYHPQ